MSTRVYLPTKENQDSTLAQVSSLQADVDALKVGLGTSRLATVTVRLNWTGQTYALPSDEATKADLLNGAKIVFNEQGIDHPYEKQVTSLTNFEAAFQVFVTDGAKSVASSVGAVLGKSETGGYAVAADNLVLEGGASYVVYLNTAKVTGTLVEVFRAQPYSANPSGATDAKLKAGNSYLGTRVTTADGTVTYFGHWTSDLTTWVDTSMTKISLWDCPTDGSTPTERVITTASDTTGWPTIEERLKCIGNIKVGTLSYTNGTTTVGDNKMVRYDKVYLKTTREKVNMPVANADGTLTDSLVDCVVKWYCDEKADADYHLHSLFEKYERNSDGTYTTTECAHGYIARYPIGNMVSMTLDGSTKSVPQWKSGTGNQYVPGNRDVTLSYCRLMNKCAATLSFDGEDDVTIPADETNRTWGVAGTAEISFLANMAYLYFGVNVQGAASTSDYSQNTFPGICTSSVNATTNGASDHVLAAGKMSGATNTRSAINTISFLGVEDGLWSSTGWYWEDVTMVTRRTITTGADGKVATNVESTGWLFAQDAADVAPGSSDLSNETTTDEAASYEGRLKAAGYRETSFAGGTSWYRAGADESAVLRDAFLPAAVQDQPNVNTGACDAFWRGSTPGNFGTFSTSTAYAAGDYVYYNSCLYRCTTAHSAGAWDDSHFELAANVTVTRRSYWLVCLGEYRRIGSSLGSFSVIAYNGLTHSYGNYWRARPFLRAVS